MRNEEDKKLYKSFLDGNNEAIGILVEKYRNNLIYFIFKYVKSEEVAKIMEKSISQIKNLLHRARVKLRKLLIDEMVVEMKANKVWVGTFNLVWNDFMDNVIGGETIGSKKKVMFYMQC